MKGLKKYRDAKKRTSPTPKKHYFFQKTNVNKKGRMSSSAKQRTFPEKKGTIFFVPESVIHRN